MTGADEGKGPAELDRPEIYDAADEALATNQAVVIDGVILIPDVLMVIAQAEGMPTPATSQLLRDDGRSVTFYRWPLAKDDTRNCDVIFKETK